MSAPSIHFALIHPGHPSRPAEPRVLHCRTDNEILRNDSGSGHIDLLVVDTRRMKPACIQASLAEVARLRRTPGVRHGVLLCSAPILPLVVAAMRAGLRDIVHEPLTARQVLRLLRASIPGHRACARQFSTLAALARMVDSGGRSDSRVGMARREHSLVQRSEQLAHTETRLSLERAALEDREQKLRASTRRFEREFAALQNDGDIPAAAHRPAPAVTTASVHPFATDLQAIAIQLAERAQALDIRERMLREMESLLTARLVGAGGEPADNWSRPILA